MPSRLETLGYTLAARALSPGSSGAGEDEGDDGPDSLADTGDQLMGTGSFDANDGRDRGRSKSLMQVRASGVLARPALLWTRCVAPLCRLCFMMSPLYVVGVPSLAEVGVIEALYGAKVALAALAASTRHRRPTLDPLVPRKLPLECVYRRARGLAVLELPRQRSDRAPPLALRHPDRRSCHDDAAPDCVAAVAFGEHCAGHTFPEPKAAAEVAAFHARRRPRVSGVV